MQKVPLAEIEHRLKMFQEQLVSEGIEAALIVESMTLYYFTGTAQTGYLYIPASGPALLLMQRDIDRALRESPLRPLVPVKSLKDIPGAIRDCNLPLPARLGMELDILPVQDFWRFQRCFNDTGLCDASPLIRLVRSVKSPFEMELLRLSATLHSRSFEQVPAILRHGVTELQLAAEFEAFSRRQGHRGYISYRGFNRQIYFAQVMSGANAAAPSCLDSATGGLGLHPSFPQGASSGPIDQKVPVFVDSVGCYDGYIIDQTRIFSMGVLPSELLKAHQVAMEIQDELVQRGTAGTQCSELYQVAAQMAKKAGLEQHFMGYGHHAPFVGHGVGLDLNEWPVLARNCSLPLAEGMVIAIEPKFVFPGLGVVGVEDTFAVTRGGMEQLTLLPREVCAV